MDQDSLQTPTDTGTRLHIAAIIVEHKTGPGSTLRYARLRIIFVVGVEEGAPGFTVQKCGDTPTCVRGTSL